jgi:hypothetical protein
MKHCTIRIKATGALIPVSYGNYRQQRKLLPPHSSRVSKPPEPIVVMGFGGILVFREMKMEKFTKRKWLYSKNWLLWSLLVTTAVPQCCNDGMMVAHATDESYYGETALKQADAEIAAAPDVCAE